MERETEATLTNHIQKWIKSYLESYSYLFYEFNDSQTRRIIRKDIDDVFDSFKARNFINDYLIICDENNNPPHIIQKGELNVDVMFKYSLSSEYIKISFKIAPGEKTCKRNEISLPDHLFEID